MSYKQFNIKCVMPYHNNLHDMACALSTVGTFEILTPKRTDRALYRTDGVSIRQLPVWRIAGFGWWYRWSSLYRAIDKRTTHILVKHLYAIRNVPIITIALIKNIPLIVMVQRIEHSNSRFMRAFLKLAGRYLAWRGGKIFTVTTQAQRILELEGIAATYIPACINDKHIQPSILAGTADELRLISIAKYQAIKNLPLLIEATAHLRAKHQPLKITLTIVGAISDPREHKNVCDLVARHNLQAIVHLLTETSNQEAVRLLAQHHLALLLSKQEALGYAVLEAMAAGLPVIVSNQAGASSYVEPGVNGIIVAPDSVATVSNAIDTYILSSHHIDQKKIGLHGSNSRVRVARYHSPLVFLRSWRRFLYV